MVCKREVSQLETTKKLLEDTNDQLEMTKKLLEDTRSKLIEKGELHEEFIA